MPLRPIARALALLALFATAGCSVLPADGPIKRTVVKEAAFVSEVDKEFAYGLIDVDVHSIKLLDDYGRLSPLRDTFGLGSAEAGLRIGRGDVIDVTIFEAGPDGLFSTTEQKQVSLPLTVQGNGRISVPYAGTVVAGGRTAEQIRGSILAVLRERAVEPDVIVTLRTSVSRTVTVTGAALGGGGVVPLQAGDERVLDVIALAGGPQKPAYETYVTLSRGGRSCTVLLQTLVDKPQENIFVRPGDTIFLSHDPRTFAAFGSVVRKGNLQFENKRLSLVEAAALAQGVDGSRANPEGYFVFRYEHPSVLRSMAEKGVITHAQADELLENHHVRDKDGRVPLVYRLRLGDPDAFFLAKRFMMRDKDTIYVSRSLSVDLAQFLGLVGQANITTRAIVADL